MKRLTAVILVLAGLWLNGRAAALAVAGDAGHLWLARADATTATQIPSVTLFHAYLPQAQDRGDDRAPALVRAISLRGQLARPGLVAHGSTATVVYRDGSVQRLTATPAVVPGKWDYDTQFLPTLKREWSVRALAAADTGGLFMLVRQEATDGQSAEQGDSERRDNLLNIAVGLPPSVNLRRRPAEARESAAAQTQPSARPGDHLLMLAGRSWQELPLPDGWPAGEPAWMAIRPGEALPTLITTAGKAAASSVLVYHPQGEEAWERRELQLPSDRRLAGVVTLEGQLLLATRPTAAQATLAVDLLVLRQDRLTPVGELSLEAPPGASWTVTNTDHAVGLLAAAADEPDLLRWSRTTLRGEVLPTQPLRLTEPTGIEEAPGYIMQMAILVLAIGLMLTFWRRDPVGQLLHLPATVVLAPLSRRAMAGLIDVFPCAAAVMLFYGYDLQGLYAHWPTSPGPGMTWPGMAPGLIVIALFLAHTTTAEALTGRSLGKYVTGLRVASMNGGTPNAGRLLARSLLKVFDLVAWLLLVLPLISPYRQRLSDIVARAVVVADVPPESESETPR